jgi:hypothetical protein
MSALLTYLDSLSSTIQSTIPPSLHPYLTRENLQSFLRIIVLLGTYLLFRPHLESLLRKISGKPDPRQAEIEARLEFLKKQQEGTVATTMVLPGEGGERREVKVLARGGKIVGFVNEDEEGGEKGKGGQNGKKGKSKGKGKNGKGKGN